MPSELFNKEFRGRKFKDFEDMLESTKLFLADRPVVQPKAAAPTTKENNKMDVDELLKNLDAFYSSYKGKGKSKGKGKFDQGYAPYNYNPQWTTYGSKGNQKGDQKGDKGKGKGGKGKGKGKGPCWTCGDPDHQQRNCPKNKMVWNDQKWVYEMAQGEEEKQENEEEKEETEDQEEEDEDMSTWSIEAIEPCKCVVPPRAPKRVKMIRVPQKKFKNIKKKLNLKKNPKA